MTFNITVRCPTAAMGVLSQHVCGGQIVAGLKTQENSHESLCGTPFIRAGFKHAEYSCNAVCPRVVSALGLDAAVMLLWVHFRKHGVGKLIMSSSPSTRFDGSDIDGLKEDELSIPKTFLQVKNT